MMKVDGEHRLGDHRGLLDLTLSPKVTWGVGGSGIGMLGIGMGMLPGMA